MCGRYALFQTEQLRERFNLVHGLPKGVKPHYNISPNQLEPVIINRDGVPTAELMKWGFVPQGAKDSNSIFRYKTFNARSESIFEKTTWSTAVRHSRCLVPANGFYEWQTTPDGKIPYYIRPQDEQLFAFAGIYSSWQDPEGVEWGTYSIVTTQSNRTMAKIDKRMPIILRPDEEAAWLDTANDDDMNALYDLMRPYSDDGLLISTVSQDVNSAKLDHPQLIVPTGATS
jgi:putative SOS response-associated peptidase YedK